MVQRYLLISFVAPFLLCDVHPLTKYAPQAAPGEAHVVVVEVTGGCWVVNLVASTAGPPQAAPCEAQVAVASRMVVEVVMAMVVGGGW